MSERKDLILDILESTGPITGTALAKECGLTKLNDSFKNDLSELVDEGLIGTDNSDRYTKYYFIEQEDVDDDEEENVDDNEVTARENAERLEDYSLPSNNYGYGVEILPSHINITCPEDNRVIQIAKTERLLVLNQDSNYRFVIESPEEILQAIRLYTSEKEIASYIVTDMSSGSSVASHDEISMNPVIIFLTISRHNKAGK